MQNITLQTSDSDLTTNEVLGRLAFAASNDSSGSDAILVAASIYAQAESEFTVSSNATSIAFATASSENATNKLRITSEGHFIPFTSGQYDLGSSAYPFRALHVDNSVYSPSGSFDFLVFNTGIADADLATGQVAWGNEAGTLEIGLTDDVKIQVGQTVLFRVKNSTGSSLSKGQAVYASGVLGGGQIIQAAKFAADESVDEVRFIGLMTDDLANGDDGFVNHFGHIKNVDLRTSNTALNPNGETWAVGDILYVDDGTAGGLTKNPPQNDIYVALVLADGQNGELFVRITDPGHITDLHDVNLSGLVDNNLMVWNSGSKYWEPTSSMTFDGTTLHTDTDGITAIFGRNNSQTVGGKVRIYVDDNDTANSVQAIKAFNAKTTGTNYGINATAHGLGATKNVGLYGWAAQATTNWGLWVDAGYGIFDDRVGIKTQSPAFDLHVNGSGYFTNDVYYGGDLYIDGDLFVKGSGIIGDIAIVDNKISSVSGDLLLFPECSGYVGVNIDDPNSMLHVYSATSGDNVFNVEGTNGSLFSVVDNLSGTLMSVNTIAGLPVLEVNSDYSVTAGRFNQNDFVITSSGNVGMGIAAPSGKLHVVGEIYVDNLKLDGNTLSTTNTNGNLILTPNGTGGIQSNPNGFAIGSRAIDLQTSRNLSAEVASGGTSTISGGASNKATGTGSTVGGGVCNYSTNNYSSIGAGYCNCVQGAYGTIAGGYINCANGDFSIVGGGRQNIASGTCSTVGGGQINCATGARSVVAGGCDNQAYGADSTVSGGYRNCAIGPVSNVAGGSLNCASGSFSTVSGGYGNCACGSRSTVGGGQINRAFGNCSTVSGGASNCITPSGACSFIGGGYSNLICGDNSCYGTIAGGHSHLINNSRYSTIAGGWNATINGDYSTVGGGVDNYISSTSSQSTIAGGWSNQTHCTGATIGGGIGNRACGLNGTVGGGLNNCALGQRSTVGGGYCNNTASHYGFVGGGWCNTGSGYGSTISGGVRSIACCFATISGGCCNSATGHSSTIGGGRLNCTACQYSVVAGGLLNVASGDYSAVVAGSGNIASGTCSFVGGGVQNLSQCTGSSIVGGGNNRSGSSWTFVGGGSNNCAMGSTSAVVGGYLNTATGNCSFIGAGWGNCATQCYSTVSGGYRNCACGVCSTVSGGYGNNASGQRSTIGGGRTNTASNVDSVVGGGQSNCAAGVSSTIAGGLINTVNGNYSTIAGGWYNCVTGNRASILGGNNNTASGVYSAILGGSYNNDGGNTSVFILGTGITATSANTTYTQKLNVSHTTEPSGTLFNVEGSNGSLFSVVDNLSGVLMSVNNNAGLPVFEVYDDDSIIAGRFAQNDFVISSGGNVGIGTASPVTKLDVSGVITATGGNSNEWNQSYDWVAASGGLPYVTGVGTANQVAFFNGTDSITSESNLYWDSTNNRLGIGTTSPNMLLHIDNSAGAGTGDRGFQLDGIRFYTGYSPGLAIQPVASESVAVLIAANPSDQANSAKTIFRVTDNTYSTPWLNIVGGGNIGVGTSSPSSKLHVLGDITATSAVNGASFAIYGDYNNKLTKSGNDFTLSAGQITTDIHLGYYNGGTLNKVVTVDSSADRVGILNTQPQAELDVNGSVYASGNVKIGTTSGSEKLTVAGNVEVGYTGENVDRSIKIHSSNPSNKAGLISHDGGGLIVGYSIANQDLSFGTSSARWTNGIVHFGGSHYFYGTSGSNTSLFIDGANGNVGINQGSPSYKLDVNGDSNLGGNVIVGGNLTVNGTTISTNVDTIEIQDPIITLGLTSGNIVTNDSYDRGVAMVTNDGTAFMGWDNSADKFVMLSSGVATNGSGNYDAGIYGDLDLGGLNVHQQTNNVGGLTIYSPNDAYNANIRLSNFAAYITMPGQTVFKVDNGAHSLNFAIGSNNSWEMKKDYIAPFGAGTNSGAGVYTRHDGYLGFYTLGNTSALNAISMHDYTNSYNWGMALHYHGSGIGVPHTKGLVLDNRGRVGINDETPSYQLDVNGTTQILPTAATETLILGRSTGYASVTSTTSNELILDSDGAYTSLNHYSSDDVVLGYGGGNVGIGTTTPSYKLEVNGEVASTGLQLYDSTSLLYKNVFAQGNNIYFGNLHGVFSYSVGVRGNRGDAVGLESAGINSYLGLAAGGSEKVRISTAGDVGIGTATPQVKLHIAEDGTDEFLRFSDTSAANVASVRAYQQYYLGENTTRLGYLGITTDQTFDIATTTSGGNIRMFTGSNQQRMQITSAGDVGIGTASPTAKLHVNATTAYDGILVGGNGAPSVTFDGTNTAINWRIGNAGSDGNKFTIASSTSSSDEHFVATSGGYIGIGTASPASKLTIKGQGHTAPTFAIQRTNSTSEQFAIISAEATAYTTTRGTSSGQWANVLESKNSNLMLTTHNAGGTGGTIFLDANLVGVGTTSPSYTLDVAGTGNFHKLLIDAAGSYSALTIDRAGSNASIKAGPTDAYMMIDSQPAGYVSLNHYTNADVNLGVGGGDVGIGTVSPTQRLDIRYPAGGGMALLKSTDTTDGLLLGDMAYSTSNDWQGMKHAAMGGVADYMIISNGTNTYVSSAAGGSTIICAGGNSADSTLRCSSTEVVVNEVGSNLDFRVESDNNANMLFVDGIADKVGIGNASPVYTLDVTGNGHFTTSIKVEDNIYLGSTDSYIYGSNNSNNIRFYDASDYIILSTVNGGAVRFDTEIVLQKSPNHQIYGPSKSFTFADFFSSSYDGYSQAIRMYQPIVLESAAPIISRTDVEMRIDSNNDSTTNKFFITKDAGTELFRIQEDGKVGIGTSSPSTQLDVVGSGNFSGDVTIDGHLSAATKSFYIDHPTKEGKLQYGSLESPYHGIRLTGRGKIEGGKCVVELPDYINALVRDDENVNIQLTNYRHGKTLYVSEVNVAHNEFTVKTDSWFGNDLEFFWSFTATRKDIDPLRVEY